MNVELVAPKLSVTVRVMLYVPFAANVWFTVAPVAVPPSSKDQEYDTMLPFFGASESSPLSDTVRLSISTILITASGYSFSGFTVSSTVTPFFDVFFAFPLSVTVSDTSYVPFALYTCVTTTPLPSESSPKFQE